MKRILLAFALVFVFCMSSLAQKTYVTVSFGEVGFYAVLSGDVPATLQRLYGASDVPKEERNGGRSPKYWMGYIINLLAKEGFSVEHVVLNDNSDFVYLVYLLSKPVPEDKKEDKKE